MDSNLEELVVDKLGVFLTEKSGGSAVTAVPVAPPVTIPADGLGNPYHYQRVLDNLFSAYPTELRGYSKGVPHDGKVPVVYFRYKVGVHVCPEPNNYISGTLEVGSVPAQPH